MPAQSVSWDRAIEDFQFGYRLSEGAAEPRMRFQKLARAPRQVPIHSGRPRADKVGPQRWISSRTRQNFALPPSVSSVMPHRRSPPPRAERFLAQFRSAEKILLTSVSSPPCMSRKVDEMKTGMVRSRRGGDSDVVIRSCRAAAWPDFSPAAISVPLATERVRWRAISNPRFRMGSRE